ncbi:MAG: acyl-CoA dehydratase activase [candidate division KSB1 bacterium]|nr:acyl-CoA dehydratase activase [candidate division KSB1 bacterium]
MDDAPLWFVGLDVGSAFVHVAILDPHGKLHHTRSVPHQGNIAHTVRSVLREWKGKIAGLGVNLRGERSLGFAPGVDDQTAVVQGLRHLGWKTPAILHIGAERFYLIRIDERGHYLGAVSNTGCASGTGSFLDQQASRLELEGAQELAQLALTFRGSPPPVATRCAVFAKTDIIHAQQKGYSLEAICAGICRGAARNVADLITGARELPDRIVLTGGVALNRKIVEELRFLLGKEILVPQEPQCVPAVGLASLALRERRPWDSELLESFLACPVLPSTSARKYHYPPLANIPYRREACPLDWKGVIDEVEVELYTPLRPGQSYAGYLGIDIGSTSTKAALLDAQGTVLLSLYTRTQGQPIAAVQRLFRIFHRLEESRGVRFSLLACGTTGSGRKLIRKVLAADLAVDEITAHARAARELRPDVDTILEIGGQDSKFTVLRNGRVTFSVMNFVCAAGTGSFLEEQARRLGVDLEEYAKLAEQASAPLTSDRCTVFMERDLNYLLSQGYSREELLAAAIHSVRDNYLTKVANLQRIGRVIVFQGATGRNAALVKAFEHKLGKPVYVSPYCHVAGAVGVALLLRDKGIRLNPNFRHRFHQVRIETREEVCPHCTNHCKITRVQIGQESIGWGYLCGREDSDTRPRREASGLNHVRAYRRMLFETAQAEPDTSLSRAVPLLSFPLVRAKLAHPQLPSLLTRRRELPPTDRRKLRFGIPCTLYYLDTLPLWRTFFQRMGFVPVSVVPRAETLERGRSIVGADFCTPLTLLHGHVAELADRCDYLFLPVLFRGGQEGPPKHYCYYSNYATALLLNNPRLHLEGKVLAPVLELSHGPEEIVRAFRGSLPPDLRDLFPQGVTERAWKEALSWFKSRLEEQTQRFRELREQLSDFGIVLLGRPYIALDDRLSHRVAERLAEAGIPVFYQEMLPLEETETPVAADYLRWNHWRYGERILRAAEFVARDEKLFPIYLTAFKCSPDSFLIPYFREIMDRYDKPYLILQIDDHSSAEGFETRLEAAVESFRNFRRSVQVAQPVRIQTSSWPRRRTYLFPNYDPLSTELIAAAFRRRGLEAIPLEETEETVQASVRHNDGQCLPFSALLQAIQHTVQKHGLDPGRTGFFLNALCDLSCNLPQYPALMKQMLEKLGNGLEQLEVLAIGTTFQGMPLPLLVDIYCGYLLGGLLQKLVCKVRPRERNRGDCDEVLALAVQRLRDAFEQGSSKELAFEDVVERFAAVPLDRTKVKLPKVAIIGDLYIRDNYVFNQNLIQELERMGAEAITTPYSFLIRLLAVKHFHGLATNHRYANLAIDKSLLTAFTYYDRKFTRISFPVLREPLPKYDSSLLTYLQRYHLDYRHPGETSQNLMKIFHLLEQFPDIRLFVHVNPVFCCPGLVSEAIFRKVEEDIGVPIVSIVYDGTRGDQNQVLRPYLHFLREETRVHRQSQAV